MSDNSGAVSLKREIVSVILTVLVSSSMTAFASYVVLRERLAVVEREIVFLQKQIDRLETFRGSK